MEVLESGQVLKVSLTFNTHVLDCYFVLFVPSYG